MRSAHHEAEITPLTINRAPDLEPFLVGRQRPDACLKAIAHHQRGVVVQQLARSGHFATIGGSLWRQYLPQVNRPRNAQRSQRALSK